MEHYDVVAVTVNPAIDRTLSIQDFRAGAVNRVATDHAKAGGKGVNVAVALRQQGFDVAASGFLGGLNPGLFESLFHEYEIADRFVRIPGETRVGIKIVDPKNSVTTDINFPGLTPTSEEIGRLAKRISTLEGKWYVLGGSLPPGMEPHFYRDLTTALKARAILVALDTSGEPLRLALESRPDLIKPNIHELEELVGEKLKTQEAILAAARSLVQRGIGLVVVSMGERGALFVTAQEAFHSTPPDIKVGSTVGAGDAMVAGTVAARLQGCSLAETARLGTAFSVSTLLHGRIAPAASLDAIQSHIKVA